MPSLRLSAMDSDRLDRSRKIAWIDFEAVQEARCLVVGGGALGNEVVKNLLLSGFNHIDIVDMDFVEMSNLNRCVFFKEEDAEQRRMKADTLAERGREVSPSAVLKPHVCMVEDLTSLDGYDVIFGCLDNIKARLHVNSHAYGLAIPYIDGGTDGMSGRVQVIQPPHTPCLQCGMNRSHFKVLDKRYSCTGKDVSFFEPKRAAEITTTSIIAAMQVREALKVISGKGERCIRHVMYYNGLLGMVQELELSIDPNCPMHGMSRSQ